MTDIPKKIRRLIAERSGGLCETCGLLRAESIHHRTPRGMGGTRNPAIHSPANLLHMCGDGTRGCHGQAESRRLAATKLGWIVLRGSDPATVPVSYRAQWVRVDNQGGVTRLTEDELETLATIEEDVRMERTLDAAS
jgi:hypothetical protein